MNLKILLPTTMIILLLSLFACKKELTDLGSDLVTDGEKIVFNVDTVSGFDMRMKTGKSVLYKQNNHTNNYAALLVGQSNDTHFGSVRSEFIAEVIALYADDLHGKIEKVDSVVVKVYRNDDQISKPKEPKGKEMNLNLYTLTDTIGSELYTDPIFFYSKDKAEKLISTSILQSTVPVKDNGDTVTFANLDKKIAEKMLINDDIEVLKDSKKYRVNFPGFRLSTENNDSSNDFFSRYTDLKTVIYYYEKGKTEPKDRKKIEISSHLFRSGMLMLRDYSTSVFEDILDKDKSSEEVYLGNLGAPYLEMAISSIQDWADNKDSDIAINKAEIRFNIKELSSIQKDVYPKNAWITGFDDQNKKIFTVLGKLDGEENIKYFYTFNITDILKKVYDKKYKISKINLSADSMEPNTCTNFFELRKVCLYSKKENLGPQLIISYTKK